MLTVVSAIVKVNFHRIWDVRESACQVPVASRGLLSLGENRALFTGIGTKSYDYRTSLAELRLYLPCLGPYKVILSGSALTSTQNVVFALVVVSS